MGWTLDSDTHGKDGVCTLDHRGGGGQVPLGRPHGFMDERVDGERVRDRRKRMGSDGKPTQEERNRLKAE